MVLLPYFLSFDFELSLKDKFAVAVIHLHNSCRTVGCVKETYQGKVFEFQMIDAFFGARILLDN